MDRSCARRRILRSSFAYADGIYFDFNRHEEYQRLLSDYARGQHPRPIDEQPAALVQAHSAPMAIEFSNTSFPPQFQNGAFVAFRGSWNRSVPTDTKWCFEIQKRGGHDGGICNGCL